MLFVLDTNHLAHMMFHANRAKQRKEHGPDAEADIADVLDWVLIRLDNLSEYVTRQHGKWGAESFKLVACFDGGGGNFRKDIVPTYKEGRERIEAVYELVDDVIEAVRSSDEWLAMVAPSKFEADDLMASIAAQFDGRVVIHSIDKDMHQCLVADRVGIIKRSGMEDFDPNDHGIPLGSQLVADHYTAAKMEAEFGFPVDRWVDYQCIVGDSADNVEGAKRFGPAAAKKIISKYPDTALESLDFDEMAAAKLFNKSGTRENWDAFIDRLPVLRKVFTLKADIAFTL